MSLCCVQSSWVTSKSSPVASFDTNEFESLTEDKTVKLASSYNWDQSGPASTTSPDPNSDDFFNSMLADDKKVPYRVALICIHTVDWPTGRTSSP